MHTDPELLSLLALGEVAGTEEERAHARTCPPCAAELSELRQLVSLGRSVGGEPELVSPGESVWARISDELALGATADTTPPLPAAAPTPVESTSKRARRALLAIFKAAVAGSSHPFDDELTAHARLSPVEPRWSQASGEAELATDEHGRRLLQVTLHADLPAAGLRQAWLVHRDDPNVRQSLGILDGPHGLWTIEHSIDLGQYAILDISQQGPGETDHSGQTIVRGEFALAG